MADIPIIFSAPMIKALLREADHPGTGKTTTRRIIKLPTKGEYVRPDMGGWAATTVGGGKSFIVRRDGTREPAREVAAIWNQTTGTCIKARYQPGDRLWVRENVTRFDKGSCDQNVWYWAGGNIPYPHRGVVADAQWPKDVIGPSGGSPYSVPCIHMPRWASRLTLIVTGTKIERLQAITEEDARAEGIIEVKPPDRDGRRHFGLPGDDGIHPPTAARAFFRLWSSLHGDDSLKANPWVVAPTFRVIKSNIDAPEAKAA